ncbi:MAG: hypothetical protein Unbinned8210contig1002_8 [Prokaryotic dsDNA virus sp.]|nr:MAG: hypothetical protein Unbinned8210contig1002_8 [Prokaryotic dsDNA virus sp.]|tara:strand:+ start:9369 stop:10118 length:750 start_codon:yes stop_codon:yes gene_type:complete
MTRKLNSINSEGQAIKAGLDVFMDVDVYSGDYLAYGESFLLGTITGSTDTATSHDDYAGQVMSSVPPANVNTWYRFHTSGVIYENIAAPSTSTNSLRMSAVKGSELLDSHTGMYQKLSGLVVGYNYEVRIKLHKPTTAGTMSFNTFYYANQNANNALSTTKQVQVISTSSYEVLFNFTAQTTNDIVFFDFSTTVDASNIQISSISVKQKETAKIIVVADIENLGMCKVLRRSEESGIELEEGDPNETPV